MALKAGLVGVNPKGVDKNGMPILSGGSVDAYTKAETNALLSGKADKSTLTANSQEFNFAYSDGKYGYKAGAAGDFHPFEEAGVTVYGWVKPANLLTTGLTFAENVTLEDGGYIIAGGKVIIDIIIKTASALTQNTALVSGIPGAQIAAYFPLVRCNSETTLEAAQISYYIDENAEGTYRAAYTVGTIILNTETGNNRYYHIYGTVPVEL